MNPLLRAMDVAIAWWCHAVLYVTLSVVFLILSTNVVLRYVAGTSLAWAAELPELMFPWMIMAGVVLAAQHGSHIAVVLLTQRLGAARRWVLAAGSLVVVVLYLGLAWTAWPVFEIAADERSPIMQVPGSVSVGCLLLGFVLLAVVTLCRLPQILRGDAHREIGADA
ncbi:TRAP transporter small permease [Paracidovorax anthurii]|uniref:TRAP transporter small permease protein n=1 Tax=Paracidovorax anthurii TaxID=78229 RepID=A0A328Z072_9BURK|nr:TRAP transporter small permease subunit [Paracidovorax anthurii]RAR76217.1 TRAP-type C4-dicarboxylate transport system permease small subunit [Paracidovorax anthurii]WCM93851.1 TRAP transporter small permease [Acidovorax sp. NCPPB 2350]